MHQYIDNHTTILNDHYAFPETNFTTCGAEDRDGKQDLWLLAYSSEALYWPCV